MIPGDRLVPWLGVLRDTWNVRPLKHAVRFNPEVLAEDTDADKRISYVDISTVDSHGRIGNPEEMSFSEAPSRARRIVKRGDVIVSTVRTYLTAISRIEADDLIVSTGFAVLRPCPGVDSRFLGYWMRSQYIVDEIVARSTGVSYPAINASEIGQLPFPNIGDEAQRTIADFLDREIGNIERLVWLKQELIRTDDERTSVVVEQLVTNGRGIECLAGSSKRLKYLLRSLEQGWSPQCHTSSAPEGQWGVLKTGCVNGGRFNADENKALPHGSDPIPSLEIRAGDVLMSRANTKELLGSAAFVNRVRPRLLLCDKLYRLRTQADALDPEFLVLSLGTSLCRYQLERDATGTSASMQNIGQDTVRELRIVVPPIAEQREMVEKAKRVRDKNQTLRENVLKALRGVEDYRSALISAAVTGQIDVRNYRPQEAAALCP
jgi:type I restriction enzyme S subunit